MLNNREIATLLWVVLLAVWVSSKREIRQATCQLLKAITRWKLLACIIGMAAYCILATCFFYYIGYWDFSMTKDLLLWFFFSAIAMAGRFVTSRNDDRILRYALIDQVKLCIFLEFIIGTYVTPLVIELFVVPFGAFLAACDMIARSREEYGDAARVTGATLAVFGVGIVGYAAFRAAFDYRALGSFNTLRAITFPIVMSVSFVPFVYILALISAYENLFIRLALGPEKPISITRYARKKFFGCCGLSLREIHRFSACAGGEVLGLVKKEDIDSLVKRCTAKVDPCP